MPLPAVLGVALGWLVLQIGMLLLWIVITAVMMWTNWGLSLIDDWIVTNNWENHLLNLPEWMTEWDEPICAANAWVPLAEGWFLFKLYWTMFVAAIPVKWTMQLIPG